MYAFWSAVLGRPDASLDIHARACRIDRDKGGTIAVIAAPDVGYFRDDASCICESRLAMYCSRS